MIEFKNVSYAYPGSAPALRGVSFVVPDGQWLTVLGANGSGKSTLGMLVNGLLLPEKGEVLIDGVSTKDNEALSAIRKKISMVFQNPDNQIVGATVEEDIAFGPCNLGLPRAEIHQRVEEALAVTELTTYRNQGPHMLSGGQKQKVALAGALAMRPRHLVLDEACSMLNPTSRDEIWRLLREIHTAYGMTIINISHFPQESLLGSGILLLEQGAVEAQLWQSL